MKMNVCPKILNASEYSVVKLVDATKPKHCIDSKILLALRDCEPAVGVLAEEHGIPEVKLAQNGNTFLINTGALTSYVEKSKIENAKDLYRAIEANIMDNKNPSQTLNLIVPKS